MKVLISGLAIILLWTSFSIYQVDNNWYIRALEDLKYAADECSAAASLYYDEIEFSNGNKVFNKIEGNRAIAYLLQSNLNLDSSMIPLANTYWSDKVEYYTYYFDDSNVCYVYKDGILYNQFGFSYGYLFTDILTGYEKRIYEPIVIVSINAGQPRLRLSFLNIPKSIRSSGYEYYER